MSRGFKRLFLDRGVQLPFLRVCAPNAGEPRRSADNHKMGRGKLANHVGIARMSRSRPS